MKLNEPFIVSLLWPGSDWHGFKMWPIYDEPAALERFLSWRIVFSAIWNIIFAFKHFSWSRPKLQSPLKSHFESLVTGAWIDPFVQSQHNGFSNCSMKGSLIYPCELNLPLTNPKGWSTQAWGLICNVISSKGRPNLNYANLIRLNI